MRNIVPLEPVDYLVIGHVAQDIIPGGKRLGGTAAYASLTAKAIGLKVGVITSYSPDLQMPELEGITIHPVYSEHTTTFENIQMGNHRVQYMHQRASVLTIGSIPDVWLNTPIVHLGPIAHEVDPKLCRVFPQSLVGLTPQGWFRKTDAAGKVHFTEWPESNYVLGNATCAVISIEDVGGDESRIEDLISSIRILVVTEGAAGARLYWNGDLRRFIPPKMEEVDPTGAGDIFASAFFIRLHQTRDPWEAARFATYLAAQSVTRPGIEGVPQIDEVQVGIVQVIP